MIGARGAWTIAIGGMVSLWLVSATVGRRAAEARRGALGGAEVAAPVAAGTRQGPVLVAAPIDTAALMAGARRSQGPALKLAVVSSQKKCEEWWIAESADTTWFEKRCVGVPRPALLGAP